MVNLTVVEPDAAWQAHVAAMLSGDGLSPAFIGSLEELHSVVEATSSGVVLLGPTVVSDDALGCAGALSDTHGVPAVVLSQIVDTDLMRRALRAGISDVVGTADGADELRTALHRAAAAARALPRASATEPEARLARTITVFGTKGGVGKTMLASNLAVALASSTAGRVALVDLDLEFGDVGIMLGLRPERTIHDALGSIERLDTEMLDGLMQHHASGLDVLLAPVRPEDADGITGEQVGSILDLVRRSYDHVVIDTNAAFSDAALAALDRSEVVYVVTSMDLACIKNTRVSLQKLGQLGMMDGRIRLVLNRSGSKVLLEPGEVAKAVGGRIFAHVPSDRLVPRSVNQGVPVVTGAPRSDVARSIVALAKDAAGDGAEARDVAQ